ncbi:ferredoxin [Puniceibacterium sediminis]
MFGPDEPRFWQVFSQSPEHGDGDLDPLDRWSKRVIGALARLWHGQAIFPSDGPPYPPFLRWAQATGRCWPSPTGLLVHDKTGLMVSFRGAIALPDQLELPFAPPAPCPDCTARPCETACPVGALAADRPYDVNACRTHVMSAAGVDCRRNGCLTRRACPVSRQQDRNPAQAAFHMAAFVKE